MWFLNPDLTAAEVLEVCYEADANLTPKGADDGVVDLSYTVVNYPLSVFPVTGVEELCVYGLNLQPNNRGGTFVSREEFEDKLSSYSQ